MAQLEQITPVGYEVEVQWECEFDHPEVKLHSVVQHSPLNTRDVLYEGRTKAMRLHHKAGEGEIL